MIDTEDENIRFTYARKFEQSTGYMKEITIQEYEKDRLVRIQNAERAVWQEIAGLCILGW